MTTTRIRLRAHLDLPDGPVELEVAAGEVRHVDDAAVVDALLGRDGRRHRVEVDGHRARRGVAGRVRRGLAVVSGAPVAGEVSVRDHLVAIVGGRRADQVLGTAPLLAGRGGDPAGVLSGGERRMLAWVRADALDPAAIVLDRAAEGLDADALEWATRLVGRWSRDGRAVVVRAGRVEERAFRAATGPGLHA